MERDVRHGAKELFLDPRLHATRRGLGNQNIVCHMWKAFPDMGILSAQLDQSGSVQHSSNSVLLIQTAASHPSINGSPRPGGWQTGNCSKDGPHGEFALDAAQTNYKNHTL